jgi:hypothetical protein
VLPGCASTQSRSLAAATGEATKHQHRRNHSFSQFASLFAFGKATGTKFLVGDQRELSDPLKMIEHALTVLRTYAERDAAIEALIRDLEDERAALVADRITGIEDRKTA